MTQKALELRLAVGAFVAAAVLYLYMIPTWVAAPGTIRNIVLSPLFWPQVLTGLLVLVGFGLLMVSLRRKQTGDETPEEPAADLGTGGARAYGRLAAMAVIMGLTTLGVPWLGMVWTSMLAFVATAFLLRTRYPLTALICAVVVPLVLYAFFAHVAGVAIPQGDFVRLP